MHPLEEETMTQNVNHLKTLIAKAFADLYDAQVKTEDISVGETKKDFAGDFTFVVFPFSRFTKTKPQIAAQAIGEYLSNEGKEIISGFNVAGGFLNLSMNDAFWKNELKVFDSGSLLTQKSQPSKILVEYSSPNTNKPLHLGHLRNNFLGQSVSNIFKSLGFRVQNVQIVNDRGIHVCKSMVSWQDFGNGETPEQAGVKGDHFVGKFYVKFDLVL